MRVVIDMQGAQSKASGWRGVGRYARELAKNLILCSKGEIEVFLALNGKLDCESTFEYFEGILDREHIKVWYYEPEVGPASTFDHSETQSVELFHEWFLHQFHADVIWYPNLQEGYDEGNIAATVKLTHGNETVISTLHDLVPLLHKSDYLKGDIVAWYENKLKYAVESDWILTPSEFSKESISELLSVDPEKIRVILNGYDQSNFYPDEASLQAETKKKFFLYAGGSGIHKNLSTLIEAYSLLDPSVQSSYPLVLVGKEPVDQRDSIIKQAIKFGIDPDQIKTPGFVSDDELRELMQSCTGFVFPSYSEGFGLPPLEAMACGAPVLVADATSLKEVVTDKEARFEPMDAEELSGKMLRLIEDAAFSNRLIRSGLLRAKEFSWEKAGMQLREMILRCPAAKHEPCYSVEELCADISERIDAFDYRYKAAIARSIEMSRLNLPVRRICVDASSVVSVDYVTGIQRVVNGIVSSLQEMYADDPSVEIRVVYSDPSLPNFYFAEYDGKKYVRRKTIRPSSIVPYHDGDIMIMPDLHAVNSYAKKDYLSLLSKCGVRVITVLHDLIPVDFPDFYDPISVSDFKNYLFANAHFSGVIGDSKASLDRYLEWCEDNDVTFPPYYLKGYNHIGCDINNANPSTGLPDDAAEILELIGSKPTVLMVGTIEPRKQHKQVLSAMETLWDEGRDINLVFVGRYGWNMEEFLDIMESHPENGKHFFWLKGISDEYLEKVYNASTGVVMASLAEGYGLPIIEAAQHGKPLLLRDIPVFREIAGDNALYFEKDDPKSLGSCISHWLDSIASGTAGDPRAIRSYTWEESTRNLITMIEDFFSGK